MLPRQWDANGHAVGILAPGGWIAKTDADGKTWELESVGYRNAYDMAFNADGGMFCLRCSMEWDLAHLVQAHAGEPRGQRQRVRLAERHVQLARPTTSIACRR